LALNSRSYALHLRNSVIILFSKMKVRHTLYPYLVRKRLNVKYMMPANARSKSLVVNKSVISVRENYLTFASTSVIDDNTYCSKKELRNTVT
jgi:hypothetical protein